MDYQMVVMNLVNGCGRCMGFNKKEKGADFLFRHLSCVWDVRSILVRHLSFKGRCGVLIHRVDEFIMELPPEECGRAGMREHLCRLAGGHGCALFADVEVELWPIVNVVNIAFVT